MRSGTGRAWKAMMVVMAVAAGILLACSALAEVVDVVSPGNGLVGRRIHGPRVRLNVGPGPGITVTENAVGISFAGVSCPSGEYLYGFDPSGNPLCAAVPVPGSVLPRGVTLRGTWKVGGNNPAGGGTTHAVGDISFGYTFAAAPTIQFIPMAGPVTTECPGTIDAPQALPGYLCLYEEFFGNNDWLHWDPPKAFGVNLYLFSLTAAGPFWTRGTWAATSP